MPFSLDFSFSESDNCSCFVVIAGCAQWLKFRSSQAWVPIIRNLYSNASTKYFAGNASRQRDNPLSAQFTVGGILPSCVVEFPSKLKVTPIGLVTFLFSKEFNEGLKGCKWNRRHYHIFRT